MMSCGLGADSEARRTFEPTSYTDFPAGVRIVSFRKPMWSDEGAIVFLGTAAWSNAGPGVTKTTSNGGGDHAADAAGGAQDAADEPAGVDVWHWRDADVMPKQKIGAKADRERNVLGAWHLGDGHFVRLGTDLSEQIVPMKHDRVAYAANWTASCSPVRTRSRSSAPARRCGRRSRFPVVSPTRSRGWAVRSSSTNRRR